MKEGEMDIYLYRSFEQFVIFVAFANKKNNTIKQIRTFFFYSVP